MTYLFVQVDIESVKRGLSVLSGGSMTKKAAEQGTLGKRVNDRPHYGNEERSMTTPFDSTFAVHPNMPPQGNYFRGYHPHPHQSQPEQHITSHPVSTAWLIHQSSAVDDNGGSHSSEDDVHSAEDVALQQACGYMDDLLFTSFAPENSNQASINTSKRPHSSHSFPFSSMQPQFFPPHYHAPNHPMSTNPGPNSLLPQHVMHIPGNIRPNGSVSLPFGGVNNMNHVPVAAQMTLEGFGGWPYTAATPHPNSNMHPNGLQRTGQPKLVPPEAQLDPSGVDASQSDGQPKSGGDGTAYDSPNPITTAQSSASTVSPVGTRQTSPQVFQTALPSEVIPMVATGHSDSREADTQQQKRPRVDGSGATDGGDYHNLLTFVRDSLH